MTLEDALFSEPNFSIFFGHKVITEAIILTFKWFDISDGRLMDNGDQLGFTFNPLKLHGDYWGLAGT